jgi:hypothetical protein
MHYLPLWRAVSSRSSEDHLRRCGLWIAGRGAEWAAAPDPHGLAHQLWLTARWAPRRIVAAFCALDTALRAGGQPFRAAVAPWIAALCAAIQGAVPTAGAAAAMEALLVTWAELGFVGPAVLGVRWTPATEGPAAVVPVPKTAVGPPPPITRCPVCAAVFLGANAASSTTFAAHVQAHAAAARHRAALAARRPSVLRTAAIGRAVAAAAAEDLVAVSSPVAIGEPRPAAHLSCPVCGDGIRRCFDDATNQWAWHDAVVVAPEACATRRLVLHAECVEAWQSTQK